ncbi:MAG: GGDEF domain-containing protein [bacterium]
MLNEEQLIHSYMVNLFGLLSVKSAAIVTNSIENLHQYSAVKYRGLSKTQAQHLSLTKSDAFFDLFQNNQAVLVVNDTIGMQNRPCYLEIVASVGGALIAPIIHRRKILGHVIISEKYNHKPYTRAEQEMFSLLTNFLAVSVTNARLYKEMAQFSVTDSLTGLFNRRYFESSLKNEVSRARRFSRPLSLVILDVDDFKNYNDSLGHAAGDYLLKKLANVLAETVRSTDTVVRYGGEEFSVILPEISSEGAFHFSERMRNVVFSYPFENREIQPFGRITISLGTATYPHDAQMMHELIVNADMALYQAKRFGKNRVAVYDKIKNKNFNQSTGVLR